MKKLCRSTTARLSRTMRPVQPGRLGAGRFGRRTGVRVVLELQRRHTARRSWPRTRKSGLALGSSLIAASGHHGDPHLSCRHSHQDRQRLQMAALLAAGGALEASNIGKLAEYGWPPRFSSPTSGTDRARRAPRPSLFARASAWD